MVHSLVKRKPWPMVSKATNKSSGEKRYAATVRGLNKVNSPLTTKQFRGFTTFVRLTGRALEDCDTPNAAKTVLA